MKKHYIILSAFLTLGIAIIIISIYISKQNLIEISQEEKELPVSVSEVFDQFPISPMTVKQIEESTGIKKQEEVKSKELLEFDLNQIPEEYFDKDIEKEEGEQIEKLSSGEKKLNKQPSLQKLRELKTKRVIIY